MTITRLVTEDGTHVADLDDGQITNGHYRIHALQQTGVALFLDCGDGRPRAPVVINNGEIASSLTVASAGRTDFCGDECTCRDRFGEVRCVKLLHGIDEWWRSRAGAGDTLATHGVANTDAIDIFNHADVVAALNSLWVEKSSAALARTPIKALLKIAHYSPASTIQPVSIARDALISTVGSWQQGEEEIAWWPTHKPPLDAMIDLWRGIAALHEKGIENTNKTEEQRRISLAKATLALEVQKALLKYKTTLGWEDGE